MPRINLRKRVISLFESPNAYHLCLICKNENRSINHPRTWFVFANSAWAKCMLCLGCGHVGLWWFWQYTICLMGIRTLPKEGQDFLENGTSSGFVAFVERGEDEIFQQKGKYGRWHFYAVKTWVGLLEAARTKFKGFGRKMRSINQSWVGRSEKGRMFMDFKSW